MEMDVCMSCWRPHIWETMRHHPHLLPSIPLLGAGVGAHLCCLCLLFPVPSVLWSICTALLSSLGPQDTIRPLHKLLQLYSHLCLFSTAECKVLRNPNAAVV